MKIKYFIFLLLIISCNKNEVDCFNDGFLVNDECVCLDGFEGAQCGIETREAFIGSWSGESLCDEMNTGFYFLGINRSPNNSTELISTFNLTNTSLGLINEQIERTVTVNDQTNFTITESEILSPTNLIIHSGSGQFRNDTLFVSSTFIVQNLGTISCEYKLTKQ